MHGPFHSCINFSPVYMRECDGVSLGCAAYASGYDLRLQGFVRGVRGTYHVESKGFYGYIELPTRRYLQAVRTYRHNDS